MQAIVPYLTVKGASEASAFYQKAFDAKENARHPAEDGKRSCTSRSASMAASVPVRRVPGAWRRPGADQGAARAGAAHHPAQGAEGRRRHLAQAVKAGAAGGREPADMFWNARFAQLRDPFGHLWMLNAQK
jgi:PhnB protein